MEDEMFQCSVITPEAQVYDGQVQAVTVPAHDGEIGILRDRAPLLCKLGAGRLHVRHGETEQNWFIDGGFAQVIDNQVVVLTQQAIGIEDLDRTEAERLLEQAHQMEATDEVGVARKDQALASARTRLRLASR